MARNLLHQVAAEMSIVGSGDSATDGTERRVPPAGPTCAQLLVIKGDGTWSARPLPYTGTLAFGRGDEADVRIDERSVSRLHAKLTVHVDGRYELTDLDSANGTGIGTTLIHARSVEVKPGDPILFGRTVVVIQVPFGALSQMAEGSSAPNVVSPAPSAMALVETIMQRVAPTHMNVLVLGETGVGKDVLAERLHRLSPRSQGSLLRLNCAGLSPALLESELFGHEKGAFTGAVQTKKGLLEIAKGGTVLLDEIAEMPLEVQAKLLLAIEQRQMRRVGATQSTPIDVRFICATHRDLEFEMQRERFRADFYFRINGVTIRIPPLRERHDELDTLMDRFAGEVSTRLNLPRVPSFDTQARAAIHGYHWPGNIRELRNIVERAVVFSDGIAITRQHLIAADLPLACKPAPTTVPPTDTERQRVMLALTECGGNQSRAAKLLGISRNTLIARIREFGLTRPRGG